MYYDVYEEGVVYDCDRSSACWWKVEGRPCVCEASTMRGNRRV